MERGTTTAMSKAQKKAIEEAVAAAGGQSALARALGVYQGAVWNWLSKGRLPAERVLDVERLTGVSRYRLRPDIFGDAPAKDAAA